MTAHSSVVGGSTARRVLNCPGSVALSSAAPPQEPSIYAIEGTVLHEAVAYALRSGIPPTQLLNHQVMGTSIDEDMVERLEEALRLFDALDEELDLSFWVEERVEFTKTAALEGAFGTADVIGKSLKSQEILVVLDFKFGRGVAVEAEENHQLMFYAAASRESHDGLWDGVEAVELVIIQPGRGMSRWRTTPERIERFRRELVLAVEASQREHAPVRPGPWCRWCPALALCPARIEEAERLAKLLPEDMTVEDIAKHLDLAEEIENWVKAVRKRATDLIQYGREIPGWKLVPRKGHRRWKDEAKVVRWLKRHGLIRQAMPRQVPSPARLGKLLKQLGRDPSEIEDLVETPVMGTALVRDDDERPSVLPGRAALAALAKRLGKGETR